MTAAPDDGTIPSYQYAVTRLTAENKDLRRQLAEMSAAHRVENRKLRAQLAEGVTPELTELRRETRHWRERAITAEGRLASIRRSVA